MSFPLFGSAERQWLVFPTHLDDVGPATSSTFGGEIQTPTLDRVAGHGISYNRFHTTAMGSPTPAALLTGRNHKSTGAKEHPILRYHGESAKNKNLPNGMSLHFTSNATFDIGRDQDSPVSLDYYDDAPFSFNGTIGKTKIDYLK